MPFSLFAARCIYVATQPLSYRMAVINRIYGARLAGHLGLFSAVKIADMGGFNLM